MDTTARTARGRLRRSRVAVFVVAMAIARRSFLAGWSLVLALLLSSVTAGPVRADDSQCEATPQYCVVVSVSFSGYGSGYARSGDGYIDCAFRGGVKSGTCKYRYYVPITQRSVSITVASEHLGFENVCIAGSSCGDGSVLNVTQVLSRGTNYPFSFTIQPRTPATLAVQKHGTGSGTVTSYGYLGIACGPTCSWTFSSDEIVTLVAAPAAGSTFVSWNADGPCANHGQTCDVTIGTAAQVVIATFTGPSTPPPSSTPRPSSTPKPSATPAPSMTASPSPSSRASTIPPPSTGAPSVASASPIGTTQASAAPAGSGPALASSAPGSESLDPGQATAVAQASAAAGPGAAGSTSAPGALAGATTPSTPRSAATGDAGFPAWLVLLVLGVLLAALGGTAAARRARGRR